MQQIELLAPEGTLPERVQAFLAEAVRLLGVAPGEAALYVSGTAGLGCLVDFNQWNTGGDLLVNIVGIALGYVLVAAMLRRGGLAPDGLRNGFGTYFGIGLLSGLATVVGLILLVIPGIVLLVRWSASYGYALGDGQGVGDALGKSWSDTGAHFWPILVALLVPLGIYAVGFILYFFGFNDDGTTNLMSIVLGNIALMSGAAVFNVIGIAVFSLLREADDELGEVFS